MKIGLLGCSPLPTPQEKLTTFAQLRTWSMLKFLEEQGYSVQAFLLSDQDSHGHNVYQESTFQAVKTFCQDCDVLITAGPFLPALVLDAIPEEIPLWLDWPSDPLADQHAKREVTQSSSADESIVQEIVRRALFRADAIGVISVRQRWASLGQLLLLGLEDRPISVCPIAYDFPFRVQKQESKGQDILLSGSLNTWLNLERITEILRIDPNIKLHCTGGSVAHFPETKAQIKQLERRFPSQFLHHGWLEEQELQQVIAQCKYATWLDQGAIEPLLGSRTRALFAIWNGLKIFGSAETELAEFLVAHNAMVAWHPDENTPYILESAEKLDCEEAQNLCQMYFSPLKTYEPLLRWLSNPQRVPKKVTDFPMLENQALRRELRAVYQSKTWRISNKIHTLFF